MSDLGTYILLIPVALMVLSFLITDNITLNILSGFFGVTGSLISLLKSLFTKTLGQVYDLKIFVITHIATYEQKKEYFILEFNRLSTEISQGIAAKLTYLQKNLSDVDFIAYDKVLNTSTKFEEIQVYVKKIVLQLALQYHELNTKKPWNLLDHVSFKTVAIGVGIICIIGFIAYNMIDHHDDLILKGAELSKTTVEGAAALTKSVVKNTYISKDINDTLGRMTGSITMINASVATQQERINNVEKSLLAIKHILSDILADTDQSQQLLNEI
jgi:hypothetical protein